MPYDLCEDDPTLDIIETAMANRGNDWLGGMRQRCRKFFKLCGVFSRFVLLSVVLYGLLLRTGGTLFQF